MTTLARPMLFWIPRGLSVAFIVFIALFALDALDEGEDLASKVASLAIHLIPSFVLLAILVVAWRREWVGALLYGGAGLLYLWWLVANPAPAAAVKWVWGATIAGPVFVIAALFWIGWLKHDEPRA